MHGTQKALMARGLDSKMSTKLSQEGWTLGRIKQASKNELKNIGLSDEFIDIVFSESRPPIPTDSLMKVLFLNRYQCCICRDPKLSVIVHHIDEWAKSRSHDISNLSVLCLNHHDQAHSQKTLSQNLDAKSIRDAKSRWEEAVKDFDAESILSAMRIDYSSWNYINELRVFELAANLHVDFSKIFRFGEMVSAGLVQPNGIPSPVSDENLYYINEGPNCLLRYLYVSKVLNAVIERIQLVNVSDHLDKGVLGFSLVSGDFIFVQGAHTFSSTTNKRSGKGRGQICEGVRRANNVEIRFVFDRWEATSSSAKNCWLTGTRNQGSLVQVKDLSREDGCLVVRGTVLGICSNLGDLKTREYAQSWLDWRPTDGSVHQQMVD